MSCASLLLKKVKQHEECHAQGIVVRPWEFLNVEAGRGVSKTYYSKRRGEMQVFFR